MKTNNWIKTTLLLGMVLLLSVSCKKNKEAKNILEDIDGNRYSTVTIGNQVWMAENLNVTHYRNGDAILKYTNANGWSMQSKGAYCEYNNEMDKATTYGRLYNWHVISDSRNICPEGWHIPTQEEWDEMINFLGGENNCVNSLKDPSFWPNSNSSSNNSGFSARPGGMRCSGGQFMNLNSEGAWWTISEICINNGKCIKMNGSENKVYRTGLGKKAGLSIRLVKD